jgi:hypothetical protein
VALEQEVNGKEVHLCMTHPTNVALTEDRDPTFCTCIAPPYNALLESKRTDALV